MRFQWGKIVFEFSLKEQQFWGRWWMKLIYTVMAVLGLGTPAALLWQGRAPVNTPEERRYGWSAEMAATHAHLAAEMPKFAIVGADGEAVAQDNVKKNVRLWHSSLKVLKGKHLQNIPQEVGDCVSWGASNAVNYLQLVDIAAGKDAEFHRIFPPYIYGTSRVNIGGNQIRGDGSCGVWAARAVQLYGVLASDTSGVPGYSGSVAREWGSKGVPRKWLDEGRKTLVRQVSPVGGIDDARNAICNGYPVTVASDVGYNKIVKQDGRLVGVRSGRWAHQMCFIGYDGSGPRRYFYLLNSWGPDAHGKPLGDEPPGGFWVSEEDAEVMVSQGDSFAFAGFDGFVAREFEGLDIFGAKQRKAEPQRALTMAP